ncbi:parallel beta-helix domain-containing protein [Erythrobacter sp. BLCC-B19]|uniref:parallel beta-helix domain-containing protein n=1 Tax=Erythrobacter sp. BLCC-B19 TaxID=3025315 RepID=UPI00235FA6A3|nr:parallel beta-helix domain-containing protein [Erythrobacter sp. BLCC-B19]WDA40060.1 right-handed parallel beta-helix repeat-containing protein [Erythrobacter sp. BLCC-B19]
MNRIAFAAALLATAAPLAAETHRVSPADGPNALVEALILAAPGDTIELGEGRFTLTDGLSLDVDGVTVVGQGMDTTILDFTDQKGAGEGLLVTSDNVTLRGFAVENAKGDGIKSKGADMIIYDSIRVEWTGGPKATNGAYGIYPVESTGVLVQRSKVVGASDAGIYVGQSRDITVRGNIVEYNVAGIEIENSRGALVENNIATHNTGGLLVFDLPGLPVMGGGDVILRKNVVKDNDTPNFAPPGNIVASVRRGTGVLVMANDGVLVEDNAFEGNATAHVMVIAYVQPFEDPRYNPHARNVIIGRNAFGRGGDDPQLDGKEQLLAAFGGALPPVLWDGLAESPDTALKIAPGVSGWTLNLAKVGQSLAEAQPGPLTLTPTELWIFPVVGAPAALEARLK